MSEYWLRTEKMTVGYDKKPLLKEIEIGLDRGQIMTLIGPNGAGKSTILKSITRQLELLGGRVVLQEKDLKNLKRLELARRMALVTTERVRPEWMSCLDVVAAGRYPYTGRLGLLSPQDREKAVGALALVKGQDLAQQDFSRLSDGQRQRVMLARALCQEPEVIVLDEPTSFLDIRYKLELLEILKELARRQKLAVVMSLHELDLAQKISDLVVCVNGEAVDRCGPPEEIFTAGYIHRLYGVECGSYEPAFGSLELKAPPGPPRVFVIGGGGSGIPVYRRLQRAGLPFAAGVLHRGDLDWPVARALAARVVGEEPFTPIGEKPLAQAARLMLSCEKVLCPLAEFGPMNEKNRLLRQMAREKGLLSGLKELLG